MPKELARLLERMVRPRKTGNEEVDLIARQNHQAYVEVVEALWHKPALRERTARFVKEQAAFLEEREQAGASAMFESWRKLVLLGGVWVAGFLIKITGHSYDVLSKVKAFDRLNLYCMLALVLNTSLQLELPE